MLSLLRGYPLISKIVCCKDRVTSISGTCRNERVMSKQRWLCFAVSELYSAKKSHVSLGNSATVKMWLNLESFVY